MCFSIVAKAIITTVTSENLEDGDTRGSMRAWNYERSKSVAVNF